MTPKKHKITKSQSERQAQRKASISSTRFFPPSYSQRSLGITMRGLPLLNRRGIQLGQTMAAFSSAPFRSTLSTIAPVTALQQLYRTTILLGLLSASATSPPGKQVECCATESSSSSKKFEDQHSASKRHKSRRQ
jgi:hypothetical protein